MRTSAAAAAAAVGILERAAFELAFRTDIAAMINASVNAVEVLTASLDAVRASKRVAA